MKELERFVNKGNFGTGKVKLSKGVIVLDRKKFAESHLRYLKSNSGNKKFLPFYVRLLTFKKIVENEKMQAYSKNKGV